MTYNKTLTTRAVLNVGGCIYLDDSKVMRGVSEIYIKNKDSKNLCYRDVLVLTFKKIDSKSVEV
jgi:hypothetical protein